MKKTGSDYEFKQERADAIMRAFRRIVEQSSHVSMPQVLNTLVSQPCQRFWVSEERATIVISSMLRGQPMPERMSLQKRRMYQEICRRVVERRQAGHHSTLVSVVREVIEQPAPEFYISPRYAQNIISKNRKKCR